jgi:hypothetical protein
VSDVEAAVGAHVAAPAGSGERIVVDGRPVPSAPGDSIALTILRGGEHPGQGGTLCLEGDCGNCLAVVDGIGYVRTCQEPARPGRVVVRHPPVDALPRPEQMPPLPVVASPDVVTPSPARAIPVRRVRADVALVGGGASGAAVVVEMESAGRRVLRLDAADGNEVVAVYAGPLVVVRSPTGMLHVEADEIVVATGAGHRERPGVSHVVLIERE